MSHMRDPNSCWRDFTARQKDAWIATHVFCNHYVIPDRFGDAWVEVVRVYHRQPLRHYSSLIQDAHEMETQVKRRCRVVCYADELRRIVIRDLNGRYAGWLLRQMALFGIAHATPQQRAEAAFRTFT